MKRGMIIGIVVILIIIVVGVGVGIVINNNLESSVVCGNDKCESNETVDNCPVDCKTVNIPVTPTTPNPEECGNGACESDEDCSSCEDDCGTCSPTSTCEKLRTEIHDKIFETNYCDDESDCVVIDTCFDHLYRLVNKEFENELEFKINQYDAQCVKEGDVHCSEIEGIYCLKKRCWSFMPD